jgi:NAD(P)-dependent dehydrogenase (short-subunit alcohol dehydrogenase family)
MTAAEQVGGAPASWALRTLDADGARALQPASLFNLDNQVAVVTGAAGGIGCWLSAGLAAAGAKVLMTDQPIETMSTSVSAIRSAGLEAEEFSCNLLERDAPKNIVEAAIGRFGRLDILVNCAGVNRREKILDVADASWDLISTVNLRAPYELSRAAARVMMKGEGPPIIHIGSLTNAVGLESVSVYGAHKAALCQLAKSMAVEWAQHGIRVNAICPGFMFTPLSKPLWDDKVRGAWLMERSLLKRPGFPDELVGCCQLLASKAGSFITGQVLYVEGGWLAGTPWGDS